MISLFRRFLNTWLARAFFVLLVGAFALWGVADVVRNLGNDTALATVGGTKIEVPEFQEMFRRQLAQVSRMLGGRTEPTPAIRQAVAGQVLDRMVVQAAIGNEVQRLGLVVPDEALRQAVFEIPAFRDPAGNFSRVAFDSVLRNNNLTEPRFLALMRSDLGQRQLMEAVQVGITPPEVLLDQVFAFQRETRVAELVELPFSAAAEPLAPTEDDLKRTYENNPPAYSAPAFRRIKAVILSPDTVARDIEVPDADLAAYYEAHKSEYVTPEKRSVEVIVAGGRGGGGQARQRLDRRGRLGRDAEAGAGGWCLHGKPGRLDPAGVPLARTGGRGVHGGAGDGNRADQVGLRLPGAACDQGDAGHGPGAGRGP